MLGVSSVFVYLYAPLLQVSCSKSKNIENQRQYKNLKRQADDPSPTASSNTAGRKSEKKRRARKVNIPHMSTRYENIKYPPDIFLGGRVGVCMSCWEDHRVA